MVKIPIPTKAQIAEAQNLSGYNDLTKAEQEAAVCFLMTSVRHGCIDHGLTVKSTVRAFSCAGRMVKVAYRHMEETMKPNKPKKKP